MPDPNKMVFVGALDVTDGELVALVIPPNADAETIRQAIDAANRQKAEAAKAESAALSELFHLRDQTKVGLS